jgi:hypothetical protein
LGKGAVNTISAKQRLNTRSSIEAELVGADDIVTQAMWTRLFLEQQGYTNETTVYQDDTSAILLEKNGTESSSKRTRHQRPIPLYQGLYRQGFYASQVLLH